MPSFFAFWDSYGGTSEAPARFLEMVVGDSPEVYAPNVLGYAANDPAALEARVRPWLTQLAPHVETMRTLHQRFASNLRSHNARFMAAFEDFDWDGQVFLMASVDAFNGAGRRVGDRGALLFGLDVIARATPEQDLAVLMHHELFHMTQAPRGDALADALWVEGLATLASIELNPGTSDDAALPLSHIHDPRDPQLDAPQRRVVWSRDLRDHEASLGPELLAVLDSTDPADYATFFLGRAGDALGARPVRAGYWYGLHVARAVCDGRSVRHLMHTPPQTLRPAIREALEALVGP